MSSRRVTVVVALLVLAAVFVTTRMLREVGDGLDEKSSTAVLTPQTAVEDDSRGPGEDDLEQAFFVGRVVDDRGRAVKGADVLLLPDTATKQRLAVGSIFHELNISKLPRTTTDLSGTFELRTQRVRGAETKMEASPTPDPILFVLAPGLTLQAFPCSRYTGGTYDAGELVLGEASGSIVARVVNPWGKPIEGARCDPYGAGPPVGGDGDPPGPMLGLAAISTHIAYSQVYQGLFSPTSDADGFVNLPGVRPGSRQVGFAHEEYEDRILKDVNVRAGEVTDLGSVVLRLGGVVQGRVLDAQRAPIEGAAVFVRDATFPPPVRNLPSSDETGRRRAAFVPHEVRALRSVRGLAITASRAVSDGNGVFMKSGVRAKQVNLYVDAAGFEPIRVERVPVDTKNLELILQREATIRLTVVDKETGSPLRAASVRAFRRAGVNEMGGEPVRIELVVRPGSATLPAMRTDAESTGTFLVSGVGPMGTDVIVTAEGYETRGDRILGVQPPDSVSRTFPLWRESSLAGRVMEVDGSAVRVATVTLSPPPVLGEPLEPITARCDADGRYSFGQLTSGDYQLSAVAEGLVHVDPIALHIAPEEEISDQDLVLERASVITGTLVTPDGVPAIGHEVVVRRTRPTEGGRRSVWFRRAGERGAFTVEGLKPGRYDVFASQGVYQEFELGSAEVRELDLVLRRKPSVQGTVTAGGQPLGGASVQAMHVFSGTDGKRHRTPLPVQTTDASGSYRLQLDFRGEYTIHAQWKGGGKSRVEHISPTWDETVIVDLALGLGVLTGRVVEQSSGHIPRGGQVCLVRDGKVIVEWKELDGQGSFAFEHLARGTYQVQAKGPEYALAESGPVTVAAQEQAEDVLLALSPGASIEGSVWSASGHPTRSRVYLVAGDPARVLQKAGTPRGAFEFRSLPPGTYRVVVGDPSYPSALQSPELHGSPTEQAAIDVTLGEGEVRQVKLHL